MCEVVIVRKQQSSLWGPPGGPFWVKASGLGLPWPFSISCSPYRGGKSHLIDKSYWQISIHKSLSDCFD